MTSQQQVANMKRAGHTHVCLDPNCPLAPHGVYRDQVRDRYLACRLDSPRAVYEVQCFNLAQGLKR